MSADSLRDPNAVKVPNGANNIYDPLGGLLSFGSIGGVGDETAIVIPRLTNSGEISAASGAAPTNQSPKFMVGFERDLTDYLKQGWENTKSVITFPLRTVAKGVEEVPKAVTSAIPWWVWAVGIALVVMWIISMLAPVFRRQ